MLRVATVAI